MEVINKTGFEQEISRVLSSIFLYIEWQSFI